MRENHQCGTFFGPAVGDALGAAVEFGTPGSSGAVTGCREGGERGLPGGRWSSWRCWD